MAPTTLAVECTHAELKDGQMKEVAFGKDGKVLLSKVQGQIYATSSQCTHYGAPLVKGVLSGGGRVVCPWHGACFDVKSGDIEDAPGLDALHKYTVEPASEGKDDRIRVTADMAIITSKKGRVPCADQAKVKKHARSGEVKGADERVIIIGGGSGGAGAVEGLRELGYQGKITMLTSEPHPPIDRTKLSKALITDASKIALRSFEEYTSAPFDVDLRVSTLVESVDLKGKTLKIEGGGQEKWDKLIVATGRKPRSLPIEGKDLEGIHLLRTIEHAKAIDADLQEGKKLVCVGSSFISMELAVLATNKKLAGLTVVGMESVPFERVLGKEVGAGFMKNLEKKGIKFIMEAGVESFVPSKDNDKRVGGVRLKDGQVLEADLVVLGTGAAPNTQILEDAGVKVEEDKTVKVNEALQIEGFDGVYAIGDICTYPNPSGGAEAVLNIEHWNVASNHGRAAAQDIAGGQAKFDKTPIFWSALGAQLRYSGNGKGFDEVHVDGKPEEFDFAAFYGKDGKVIASASMGRDPLNSQVSELFRIDKMPSLAEIKGGRSPLDVDLSAVQA